MLHLAMHPLVLLVSDLLCCVYVVKQMVKQQCESNVMAMCSSCHQFTSISDTTG